jgi:putative transposase
MDAPLRSNHNVTYVCTFHVVFCPKYRRKVLVPPVDARLKEIVREQCAALRQDLLAVEVLPDHVHVLVGCDPQFGIHRLVKQIKGVSSRLLRQEYPALKRRLPSLWTNSYYVATTGGAPLAHVKQYVESQKGR